MSAFQPTFVRRIAMTHGSPHSLPQCFFALTLFCAILGGYASPARATLYDFLSVTGNNVSGNGASTTFTSNINNGANGVISVTHQFSSPAAVGYADNINTLIFPSQFSTLFPGTTQVQGHLAMTVYGNPNSPGNPYYTSQVVFNLQGYFGSLPDLVFGIWNTTDEVALPAYNLQLRDSNGFIVPPTSLTLFGTGYEDNQGQVAGRHRMQLNTSTGDITAPTLINNSGVHTDAMFLKGLPVGTQEIIVTAHLPPLNTIGDGVGYYFAEQVPEPSTWALSMIGAVAFVLFAARNKRRKQ